MNTFHSIVLAVLFLPTLALAQSDGSIPPRDASGISPAPVADSTSASTSDPIAPAPDAGDGTSASTATSTQAPVSSPAAPAVPALVATTTRPDVTPKPRPMPSDPTPGLMAPSVPPFLDATGAPLPPKVEPPPPDSGNMMNIIIVLGGLSLVTLGYLAMLRAKKGGEKSDDKGSHCLDLKKLMEKKLAELTDIRGRIESKAKERVREKIREGVEGTRAEEPLALLEAAEREYGRLKKLYEECILTGGKPRFRGTIIERSLKNTQVLEKTTIERTYPSDDDTLYDILIDEDHISEFAQHLAPGPWYAHFWKPGSDRAIVVFRDRTFEITISDTATWRDAVAYGISIGIPKEELDFKIPSDVRA